MKAHMVVLVVLCAAGCVPSDGPDDNGFEGARQLIFNAHDAVVAAMVEGSSTAAYHTSEWRGVNLNGTPMSVEGFEGEARAMEYDRIEVLDRDVRVYGETAALRWHAHFYVKVNGTPSYAEMRILDVYVLQDQQWLLDLTQVTPVFGTVGNPPAQ